MAAILGPVYRTPLPRSGFTRWRLTRRASSRVYPLTAGATPWWDGGLASIVLGTNSQPTMPDPAFERDIRIRLAAFSALRKIAERNGGVITRAEMTRGFEFSG